MPIVATGTMPATILENEGAADWSAAFTLSGVTDVSGIALTGANAALFDAALDSTGKVVIRPVGALDREAYAAGADPVLSFGLSVRSGTTWTPVEGGWSVTLAGVDDTAPSNLRFSTGGQVLENDVGASIGSLAADDPDSAASRLEYRVLWPDSAYFEIVGTTLRLKDGVDLLRLGGTTREVMIAVSDGLNESAFSLGVSVVNVTDQDGTAPSPPPPTVSPPPSPPPPVSPPPVSPPPVSPPPSPPPVSPPPPPSPPVSPPPSPPAADIVVTHTGSSTSVAEGGATDTFTVQLSRQPTAPVTVTMTVGDELNLARSTTGSPGKTVSFTIAVADWNKPRTVIVSAAEDLLHEGTESARVVISVTSSDTAFAGLAGRGVDVTITDNDPPPSPPPPPSTPSPPPPAVTLVQTGGTTAVTEGGAGDSFTIALAARPAAPVIITLSGGPDLLLALSGGVSAAAITITFTPSDWASARAVMVAAVNDGVAEGTEIAGISFDLSSADPGYNRLGVSALPVAVTDGPVAPLPPPPPPPPASSAVTLTPGSRSGDDVMSVRGDVVLSHPAAEAVSLTGSRGNFLVTWRDGTTTQLSGATQVTFSDGQLVLDLTSSAARVLRAYEGIEGITPTAESLQAMVALLNAGVPLQTLTYHFLRSPEWAARGASLSTTQQIQLLHQDIIGVSPDAATLSSLEAMSAGGTRLDAVSAYLIDTFGAAVHTQREKPGGIWLMDSVDGAIVRAYDAALDMAPDATSLAYWSHMLKSGAATVRDIYVSLASTDLFHARFDGLSNAAFVRGIYQQAMERDATAPEIQIVGRMLDGGSVFRVDILNAIGEQQPNAGRPPGYGGAEYTAYEVKQASGEVLVRGKSLAEIANSATGHVVTTRSAGDVARLDVGANGVAIHWKDGTEVRLGSVEGITFSDGHLDLDGSSRAAVVTRLSEAIIGIQFDTPGMMAMQSMLDRGTSLADLAGMFFSTDKSKALMAGLDADGQLRFVYNAFIGHAPNPETFAYLKSLVQLQGMSVPQVTAWLAQLPEPAAAFEKRHPEGIWQPDAGAAAVIRAYDAMLDSAPDPDSLMIWKAELSRPAGLARLYEALGNTELHHALYDGRGWEDWVIGHFRAGLERDPSASELAAYTSLLVNNTVPVATVAMSIGELQPLVELSRSVSSLNVELL